MKYFLRYSLRVVVTILAFNKDVADARNPMSNEARIRDYLLNQANFSARERPVLDSDESVHVEIMLQFYAMLDLNERDQVITTASWLNMRWTDERLSWNASEFGGEDVVVIFIDEIWTPKLFISNALDIDSLSIISPERGSILLTSDGSVSLGTPLVLSTQCPILIYYFPFDTQVCPFFFFPQNQHSEKLILTTKTSPVLASLEIADWKFSNLTSHNYTIMKPDFAKNLPLVNINIAAVCLILERNPEYYIQTLMLPSTLLCIMAFATFIAPPDSGERISLGVSMVLGLTVFQLLVADILPSTNERPILSSYLISTFVLACLAVPVSLLNINIAYGDRSILVLKYTFSRKLFLEYLPRMTVVPSFSERIRTLMEETAQTELWSSSINGIGPKLDSAKQISLESEEKHISKAEKAKIQARTVALVMDRLVSLVFITVFAVLVIKTLFDFSGNSGAQSDICQSFDKTM